MKVIKSAPVIMFSLIAALLSTSPIGCRKKTNETSPPVAILRINPSEGTVDEIFTFNGSASYDQDNTGNELLYRWDSQGDGIWDIDWTATDSATYQYTVPGTYQVVMEVKNQAGATGQDTETVVIHGASKTF